MILYQLTDTCRLLGPWWTTYGRKVSGPVRADAADDELKLAGCVSSASKVFGESSGREVRPAGTRTGWKPHNTHNTSTNTILGEFVLGFLLSLSEYPFLVGVLKKRGSNIMKERLCECLRGQIRVGWAVSAAAERDRMLCFFMMLLRISNGSCQVNVADVRSNMTAYWYWWWKPVSNWFP